MMDITKIEVGQVLTKETWLSVRDDLAEAFVLMAESLRRTNYEGQGEKDAEEFMMESLLALQAMTYVANNATDKCRIIVLPQKEAHDEV